MRLGVDLDNTLICYDEVFLWGAQQLNLIPEGWEGGRRQVRQYLRDQPDGENIWQRLQGQAYGQWIHRAKLFPGVYRFLWRCHYRRVTVEVVSHKSEYGHFDERKVSLRQSAENFLIEAGVFSKKGKSLITKLEFCAAQEEKIKCISGKEFDWFIDDLPEILESDEFPETTNKLGFDPIGDGNFRYAEKVSSWVEIENRLLGQWTDEELLDFAREVSNGEVTDTVWQSGRLNAGVRTKNLGGRRNAGISRVKMSDGSEAALKIYPDDEHHDRLYSEFEGLSLLCKYNISQVPEPIAYCRKLNAGMYDWIQGEPVNNPTDYDVKQALDLLERIHVLRNMPQFDSFPSASAAIFSGHQLEQQIQDRLRILDEQCVESRGLQTFLINDLKPTAGEIIQWCKLHWPKITGYYDSLPFQDRTLSPSDFGFHNALRQKDSQIIFFDFEYFGWDDPAKLTGDFILHPGMELSNDLRRRWIVGAKELFGEAVISRLRIMWPLLGLCWCLILLNEFRRDIWARRTSEFGRWNEERYLLLDQQLRRSREHLNEIQSCYRDFPYG